MSCHWQVFNKYMIILLIHYFQCVTVIRLTTVIHMLGKCFWQWNEKWKKNEKRRRDDEILVHVGLDDNRFFITAKQMLFSNNSIIHIFISIQRFPCSWEPAVSRNIIGLSKIVTIQVQPFRNSVIAMKLTAVQFVRLVVTVSYAVAVFARWNTLSIATPKLFSSTVCTH